MIEDNVGAPSSILKQAIKAVPAVKYALGIAGIIAVIAIVRGFGIDLRVAVFGAIVMFVLMTMLVVFASLAREKGSQFRLPALVFTWFSLICVMAVAIALFTSVFWGRPVDLRTLLAEKAHSSPTQISDPTQVSDDQREVSCSDVVDVKKIGRPEVHLPNPDPKNSHDTKIPEFIGNSQASAAIETMGKLLSDTGNIDQCYAEAAEALKLWDHAQANWRQALEIADDQNTISYLKAMLQAKAGITCSGEDLCEANNTEFHHFQSWVVPVAMFPPRSGGSQKIPPPPLQ
jgi:hypothetical protein